MHKVFFIWVPCEAGEGIDRDSVGVNRQGGDVTVVQLPEISVRGNTDLPMSDLNNVQIADQMSKFLSGKKLD